MHATLPQQVCRLRQPRLLQEAGTTSIALDMPASGKEPLISGPGRGRRWLRWPQSSPGLPSAQTSAEPSASPSVRRSMGLTTSRCMLCRTRALPSASLLTPADIRT